MLSELTAENVTVLLIIIIGKLIPCCAPINTNEGRNVQAVAISGQLFCKLRTRHFALVSISERLQILLAVEFNERSDCRSIVVFQEFINLLLIINIFCLQFLGVGDNTTRLQNRLKKCSESRFAILTNITAGKALRRAVGGFHLADHFQESGTSESVGHLLFCLVCEQYKRRTASVAVADVPVPPLTVGSRDPTFADVLCTFASLGSAPCTDAIAWRRIGGSGLIDLEASAVDWFELCFVHVPMIAENGMEVKRSGRFPDRHMPLSISAIAS